MTGWTRAGWVTLTVLAMVIGLASLRYALPGSPLHAQMPNFVVRHGWLVAHAVLSSVALLVGPWQFLPIVRRRWRLAHRWLGRVYCGAVLLGWVASIPVALHAAFGPVSSAGFVCLGLLWVGFTAMGYGTIRRGMVAAHREWMIRSYAMTAAAIALRIWLPLMLVLGIPFATSYRVVAWLCWVPNLVAGEAIVRWGRRDGSRAVAGRGAGIVFDRLG